MNMMQEPNNVFKETLTVLSYCENNLIEKIPNKVLQKMSDFAADSDVSYFIDKNLDLSEQKLSEECKDLLALIYYDYVAEPNEKIEILKKWKENERVYQEEIREKYSNLFADKEEDNLSNDDETKSENMPIKYNNTFFAKIKELIKRILFRNKK